jgi:hypothetical protein
MTLGEESGCLLSLGCSQRGKGALANVAVHGSEELTLFILTQGTESGIGLVAVISICKVAGFLCCLQEHDPSILLVGCDAALSEHDLSLSIEHQETKRERLVTVEVDGSSSGCLDRG